MQASIACLHVCYENIIQKQCSEGAGAETEPSNGVAGGLHTNDFEPYAHTKYAVSKETCDMFFAITDDAFEAYLLCVSYFEIGLSLTNQS